MAVLGVALGLALSGPLARFAMGDVQSSVSRFMMPITPAAPQLTLSVALWSAAAGLVTTLLAAYLPARGIVHIDPAESLRATRATAMTGKVPARKYARVGALVLLLACVPAWLGGELNGYLSSLVLMLGATLLVPIAVKGLRLSLLGVLERGFGIPARLALDNVERSLALGAHGGGAHVGHRDEHERGRLRQLVRELAASVGRRRLPVRRGGHLRLAPDDRHHIALAEASSTSSRARRGCAARRPPRT